MLKRDVQGELIARAVKPVYWGKLGATGWGRSELVNYVNESGVELQGALIYPANYRKGRKYPMVTYIYERLSQNLHRYVVPSETHPYNPAVFSAEGYFVFMPDIVYRPQEPGPSAVECIVPGVRAVLDTGMVDPARVALIGHSWGAYQTAFTVTHSDTLAAAMGQRKELVDGRLV